MITILQVLWAALLICALGAQSFAQFRQSAGDSIQGAVRASAEEHPRAAVTRPERETSPLVDGALPEIIGDPDGFEWNPYLRRVLENVRNNWLHLINSSDRNFNHRKGKTVVTFVVSREGEIRKPEITLSSDQEDLDKLALQSVALSNPLPSLPKGSAKDELKLRFTFMFFPAKEPVWRKKH